MGGLPMTVSRFALLLPLVLLLSACQQTAPTNANKTFEMGEKIELGPFTYNVVEASWATQLGEGFQLRAPKDRFLILTISARNGTNKEASFPMLTLEGSNGKTYQELSDGSGVSDWLGILRTVTPEQNMQGRIVFDVPLSSFRLRLPDGGETGYEKYAFVNIPLRIDPDQIQTPLPSAQIK
jgi:hypothetical protein